MDAPQPADPEQTTVRVVLSPANFWRICLVAVLALALVLLLQFVLTDGGSLIFTVVMSWFLSLAMEPAVLWLSRYVRRWIATAIVMVLVGVGLVLFLALFGQLFLEQVANLLRSLPQVLTSAVNWVNAHFGTSYQPGDVLDSLNLTPSQAAEYAGGVLGGVLGLIGTVVGAIFGSFTMALFTFYLSADGPRLRRWLATLLPRRYRPFFEQVWQLSTLKTGGYVAARVTLASINAATTAIVFVIIGMPSWLALALWTGIVAQFIPTIGTYISIALPVLVGLMSPNPWVGVAALVWGIAYQQVENLTIEPRISARAVDIHPAVSFGSVILGGALFGAAGALLAIPVVAMLLAVLQTYVTQREALQTAQEAVAAEAGDEASATEAPLEHPPVAPDATAAVPAAVTEHEPSGPTPREGGDRVMGAPAPAGDPSP